MNILCEVRPSLYYLKFKSLRLFKLGLWHWQGPFYRLINMPRISNQQKIQRHRFSVLKNFFTHPSSTCYPLALSARITPSTLEWPAFHLTLNALPPRTSAEGEQWYHIMQVSLCVTRLKPFWGNYQEEGNLTEINLSLEAKGHHTGSEEIEQIQVPARIWGIRHS